MNLKNLLCFVALFLIAGTGMVNAQRITVTIAGTGLAGHTGDGRPAKAAKITAPQYICTDPLHNIYIVDGSLIRKISSKGIITTIAGGGTSTLDGIPATAASIAPMSICADGVGNVYFVTGNKVKKVDAATNIMTTFAGTGTAGYSGDGGPAASAMFSGIGGICTDPMGNVIVVDKNNKRIRKIIFWSGIVSTIAGNGISGYTGDGGAAIAATLNTPNYICSNSMGDIYFTDQNGTWIRSVNFATGIISTYAGGGGGIDHCHKMHTILDVSGMCFDHSNNLCWNEISCSCRKIDHLTDTVNYIAGDYFTESFKDDTNSLYAWMNNNTGLAVDAEENLYVADQGNNRIRKLIKLTSTPTFEYGKEQSINVCSGSTAPISTPLAITDLDMGQTETWFVVTPPVNGTITGLPATAASCSVLHSVFPPGIYYTAPVGYTGTDSFRVRVSDGLLSDTVTIYVYVSSASAGSITGPSNVCVGATVTLVGTVEGTWSASNGNAVVTAAGVVKGIAGGSVTITYFANNACGTVPTIKSMTVSPRPHAGTIVASAGNVCKGGTITLSSSESGGIWSTNSISATVSSTGVVTGISPGMVQIEYRVTNLCGSDSTSKNIMVKNCNSTGIQVTEENTIKIYPNPASSLLNIEWTEMPGQNANAIIADVTGRVVLRTEINTDNNNNGVAEINVSGLVDGVYIVTISSESIHYVKKIVVSKR